MFRAQGLTWISEPTDEEKKHFKKFGFWPKWMLWRFKSKFENRETKQLEECDTVFYMNEREHNIYLAEKAILDYIDTQIYRGGIRFKDQKVELLTLIEKYGEAREEKGRYDVHEDWAESDAGESV